MSRVDRGSRLREWRQQEGLTLAEVAGLTGYSIAMLSRAERGERVFRPKARIVLARRLAVPVHLLFEPDDNPILEEQPA